MTARPSTQTDSVASHLDLVAATGYVVFVTSVLALPGDPPTAVALPLALPVFLFLPGYVVVTALAPETAHPTSTETPGDRLGARETHDGLSPLERGILSVVTSVAVVPMVALVLNFVVGVALLSTMAGVAVVTGLAALVAARRRETLGHGTVSAGTGPSVSGRSLLDGVPTDGITLGCAAIALLLLVSSATIATTGDQRPGTEFYVVTETADGEYEASGYPTDLASGEPAEYALGVEHHGPDAQQYTVVAQMLKGSGDDANATVTEREELDRFSVTVEPGTASVEKLAVTPTTTGDDLTLAFLLYEGEAPDDPTRESAHRVVHLPVDVS